MFMARDVIQSLGSELLDRGDPSLGIPIVRVLYESQIRSACLVISGTMMSLLN